MLEGVKRRLVGFRMTEPRVVARHGYGVYLDGTCVDVVRSGTVTPTANWAIGMTYLPVEHAKPGERFEIDVRGKRASADVAPLPFVPRRTKK
jgi:aminomethyltransferase